MHYAFIRIHTYLIFYTYSYVFTISHGNPAKSRDFGTHAYLSSRIITLPTGPKSADHYNDVDLRKTKKFGFSEYLPEFSVKSCVSGTHA